MSKNAALSLREPLSRRSSARPALEQAPLRRVTAWHEAPRVVPVYWDKHFQRRPSDVVAFNEFLRILFESTFMNGLAEHGVEAARLLPAFVPDEESPTRLTRTGLEAQLKEWLAKGAVAPAPRKLEDSLLFLVIAPLGSQPSLGAPTAGSKNFGYHDSVPFVRAADSRSSAKPRTNLHYAVVPLTSTGSQILEVHSRAISHQLARAFVARAKKS